MSSSNKQRITPGSISLSVGKPNGHRQSKLWILRCQLFSKYDDLSYLLSSGSTVFLIAYFDSFCLFVCFTISLFFSLLKAMSVYFGIFLLDSFVLWGLWLCISLMLNCGWTAPKSTHKSQYDQASQFRVSTGPQTAPTESTFEEIPFLSPSYLSMAIPLRLSCTHFEYTLSWNDCQLFLLFFA